MASERRPLIFEQIDFPDFLTSPDRACNGADPNLFFPDFKSDPDAARKDREARALCRKCPYQQECLDWAMTTNDWGIWGGYSRRQRQRMAEARRKGERITLSPKRRTRSPL